MMDIVHIDEQTIFSMNDQGMMPQLMPGSALSGNYIYRSMWSKQMNGVYAVVLHDGNVLIRRIKRNDMATKGLLELTGDNASYSSMSVGADEIQSMYAINAIIRQEVV